jgi:hypothetical protein
MIYINHYIVSLGQWNEKEKMCEEYSNHGREDKYRQYFGLKI